MYCRVSSKDQEREGFSIPAQQKLLQEYASAQNIEIIREFVDIETAKRSGRSGFLAMMNFLGATRNNGSPPILLVEKTDRLYRNIRDWVTIDELALEIHFVKENVVLSSESRSSEKFMHGIKVLMAKNYVDNLSEETKKGMTEKAQQGYWPSYAPIGYTNALGINGKRTIEPDPILAPIVKKLFELYSTGEHSIETARKVACHAGLTHRGTNAKLSKSTVHKIRLVR
ncbi:recombinase family protein [bacterium]|nr:recombinase family protein [bacterium]